MLSCVKQETWSTTLLPESNSHKIISEEMWYLFITTCGWLPPFTGIDWVAFSAWIPTHRWHLHLSWPECEGEGESPKQKYLHSPNSNPSKMTHSSYVYSITCFDKSHHCFSLKFIMLYPQLLMPRLHTSKRWSEWEEFGLVKTEKRQNKKTWTVKSKLHLTSSFVASITISSPVEETSV